MRVYAKQVPPEHQQSPFEYDPAGGLYVWGNHRLQEYGKEEMGRLWVHLCEAAEDLDGRRRRRPREQTWSEALHELFPKDSGSWSRAERVRWAEILKNPGDVYGRPKYALLCAALELLTGKAWDWRTITGCCQGDFQLIVYRPDWWPPEALERLEAEYFNTGSEWLCTTDDNETPLSVYCYAYDSDGLRAEIADAMGCDPGDVTLYHFDGWARTASYREEAAP
jgi:hypothetical protein